MAYWQFDLKFVNLAALPAGAYSLGVYAMFSTGDERWFEADVPATGDLSVTLSTAAPPYNSPFELSSEDKAWFQVTVLTEFVFPGPQEYLSIYQLGPYTVGDIGTEVPAP